MNAIQDFSEHDVHLEAALDAIDDMYTVAAEALEAVLAHPLSTRRDAIVIQADLVGEDEEYSVVQLALLAGTDVVCVLGGEDADGSGTLLAVQANEDGAWIGYCRAFSASVAAQAALVPLDPAHDLHLVMNVDGRLERREGRPATHPAFGHRIATARIRRAADAILADDEEDAALAA